MPFVSAKYVPYKPDATQDEEVNTLMVEATDANGVRWQIPQYATLPDWVAFKQNGGVVLPHDVGALDAKPTLTALLPASVESGGPDINFICEGTNFNPNTTIVFNNSPEPTTLLSGTQVTTIVKVSMNSVAVDVPVYVTDGTNNSAVLTFSFVAPPAPAPEGLKK